MKHFYLTTAIDYANGSPHLGHAYEKVLSDVIVRYRRLQGQSAHFLTGLDEHGQKVQQSARKQGIAPQAFCDAVAAQFKDLCATLSISNDDFIRTTEQRHKDVVRDSLQKLYDKGDIYKGQYSGYYSARQEQFLQERDKQPDGSWPEIYGEVTEFTEDAYFFKLSQYQDWLIDFLAKNEDFIFPRFRQKQVLEFLKEPLNDLCISRPKERLEWGIPLPFAEDFVCYVWFDALTNYITGAGYGTPEFDKNWPADFHVIGKDILVPPHAVYWPIMLHALGIEAPRRLLVHGWWNIAGAKMSKSLGNSIDPFDLSEKFGTDALRYFFIREMNVGQDSDFSFDLLQSRYQSDLGNDLGNLVSRLLNMGSRYAPDGIPAASIEELPEKELKELWAKTAASVLQRYDGFQFHSGLEETFVFIRAINRYAEQRAPWQLAKSAEPQDSARLQTSLATMAEAVRLATTLLLPVMPNIAAKIFGLLGSDTPQLLEGELEWSADCLKGRPWGEKTILFPRIES